MICTRCGGTGVMEDKSNGVGERISILRNARDWTQQDLAGRVGLSRTQVCNIEVGRSDMPLSTLKKFAEAFGVPMKDLLV